MDPDAQDKFTPNFLGTAPFGLPGSLGQKTSDLSIASFAPSNYSVALKRMKYPSNPTR